MGVYVTMSSLYGAASPVSGPGTSYFSQPPKGPSPELDYLGLGVNTDCHITKLSDCQLFIQLGNHIPISVDRFMGTLVKYEHFSQDFTQLGCLLYHYLLSKKYEKTESNHIYEALFNPSTEKEQLSEGWRCPEGFTVESFMPLAEVSFLDSVVSLMRTSNFSLLYPEELTIVEEITQENAKFTNPVRIDWNKLDGSLLASYYEKLSSRSNFPLAEIPDYSKRCLIFWRGIKLRTHCGYYRLQKFDMLLQTIASYSGLNTLAKMLNLKKDQSGEKLFSSTKPTPQQVPQTVPKLSRQSSCIHEGITVTRKSLNISCSPMSFFTKEEVIEPEFEELILLYRKRPDERSTNPQSSNNSNGINIQRFTNIPMREFTNVFPAKRASKNFADYFYMAMIISWLSTLFFKLQHAWSSATYLDEAAIAILFIFLPLLLQYFAKQVITMRSNRSRLRQSADTIFQTSLNCNKSVLGYCRDESVQQTMMNVMLGYYALLKNPGGISGKHLDEFCENVLSEQFGHKTDFNSSLALELLQDHEMCYQNQETGDYYPLTLETAQRNLQDALNTSVLRAF